MGLTIKYLFSCKYRFLINNFNNLINTTCFRICIFNHYIFTLYYFLFYYYYYFYLYFFFLQINATTKQLDSVTTVMNELEEKEQVYQTAINNLEKEINLRQQSLELHRKKALEYAQNTSELKLNLGDYFHLFKYFKR